MNTNDNPTHINCNPEIIKKGWGREIIIHNGFYCMKLLEFNEKATASLHLHLQKTETWYVASGLFLLVTIDPTTADETDRWIGPGSFIHLPAGTPHQLYCDRSGTIVEASTYHDDHDCVRIKPGDSQKQ
jgi:mannose-6-phosphate isomerase-like protein (cupin superfamily)